MHRPEPKLAGLTVREVEKVVVEEYAKYPEWGFFYNVAERLGVSYQKAHNFFRKHTGKTPYKYLDDLENSLAKEDHTFKGRLSEMHGKIKEKVIVRYDGRHAVVTPRNVRGYMRVYGLTEYEYYDFLENEIKKALERLGDKLGEGEEKTVRGEDMEFVFEGNGNGELRIKRLSISTFPMQLQFMKAKDRAAEKPHYLM